MRKFFTHLFALLLLSLVGTSAWAQQTSLTSGKVYHFQNVGNSGVALATSSNSDVAAVAVDKAANTQHWYCETVGGYYTFRSLANGRYLKGNGTSASWSLTEANSDGANKFNLITVGGSYNTIYSTSHSQGDNGGGGSMHKDGSNNIVGWGTNNTGSQWVITEIEYSSSELEAALQAAAALIPSESQVNDYQTKLSAIFSDKACTKLNSAYTSMSDAALESDANYLGLPQVLKDMVDKVRGGDWSEAAIDPASRPNGNNTNHGLWTVENTWNNEYAKKFRVQMYEPYSIEGEVTSYLRINAHCNMDNPTGIYANNNEPIYIMVEGDIADGSELWIAHQSGLGATSHYSNYTQLKTGLNVIPYYADGCQLWINYVVHTYNGNGATIEEKFPENRKLSKYKPLKIHIEGGHINGYFNAMGDFRAEDSGTENLWGEVDNDADWNYYKARVALATDFALLGHRQTLLFPFGTYDSGKGHFSVQNDGGGFDYALAYHLENIDIPGAPNCYGGSGNTFGDFSETYYPGMNLVNTDGTKNKINIMLEAWDRIMYSEHATMGLLSKSNIDQMNKLYPGWTSENTTFDIYNYGSNDTEETYKAFCQGIDYSEYYNHHGAAVGSPSGYMSGGWRVCNYHYNTMGSIIGKIAFEAGPTWGPAHEIGHQHQTVFNLNGQTEVTNNFFSNVAVWYMGMGTSRYNGSEGSLANVLSAFNQEDNDLYTNNIWAITHLYYRLWLYYHLAGNNTQFWPRLFELCRQIPIVNGAQISGETSLLRFYQHACTAAGEDLTEFFRAHGYFELMTNRLVGDYANGTYNVTEEQIETAIQEIKDEGYPVNYAVLLINDGTSETTVKHDGVSKRALWDGNPSADLGSVNDFIDGNVDVTEAYTATVDADGNVTMSGEGGVGFLILNEDGELVSFSNNKTFALSDEAAYLVATGQAKVVAVDSKSNTQEAEVVDLTDMQSGLLETLIDDVEKLLAYKDDTYTHVGYYKASALVELEKALETASATLKSGTGLAAAYELLYTEYQNVISNDDARVSLISGAKYAIKSKSAGDYMTVDANNNVATTNSQTQPTADSDLWIIEFESSGSYKIKNASTSKYLQEVSDENSVNFTVGDNSVNYNITNTGIIYYAFSTKKYSGRYMDRHSATQVATWNAIGDNAKWSLTLVDDDLAAKTKSANELQALINKTEALVNSLATVTVGKSEPFELQTTASGADYYIWTDMQQADEGPIANLVNGSTGDFFHTKWSDGATTPGSHYVTVDLGSANSLDIFMFSCTARNGGDNQDIPYGISIYGSNTKDSGYTLITDDVNPDFSLSKGAYWESIDPVIAKESYRYLRFNVYASRGYWAMAEFDLYEATINVALLNEYAEYSAIITDDLIKEAYEGFKRGEAWLNCDDATSDQLDEYKETLQGKYDALYEAYKEIIDTEKDNLDAIISLTNNLIDEVGEATVVAGGSVALNGKLYAERPYTAGGESHSDYSSQATDYNLLDGDKGTFFHSDYNVGTMVSPPYIRVDLGEGKSITQFKFSYTTRSATGCAPKTIEVYGGNAVPAVEHGAIMSSAELNAITTPTEIIVQSFSSTNSAYLGGATNVTDINQAVLVWEPVTEGTPGTYYLRTTDAENGYIQESTGTDAQITLGTKANAQVFVTTAPTTSGSGATYFNGEELAAGADDDNLVRFVQNGQTKWLNVNNSAYAPRLGNSGSGAWTVHNVYTVAETSVIEYDSTPLATFASDDASNALPLTASTDWTSTEIGNGNPYRYLKFSVTNSEGTKGTNNDKYYFVMSEFGVQRVGVENATVKDTYSALISEELLIDTRRTVNDSEVMSSYAEDYSVSVEQLKAQQAVQQEAYDKLLAAKENTSQLKEELQSVYDDALELYNKMSTNGNPEVNVDYSPSALTNAQLETAKNALDNAKTVLDDAAAQPDAIGAAKLALQQAYDALLDVEEANKQGTIDTDELETLISNVEALIAKISVDAAYSAITLQADNAENEFYLSAKATGSGSVANLLDKNANGTGITAGDSYYGSGWEGNIEAFSQYLEVDLGTGNAINELKFDYATRDSDSHATERPNAIKVLGSNNKVDYTEITTITDGLATEKNQQWSMETPLELGRYYRYLRFTVDSEAHSFHMSDFNLYANVGKALSEYYSNVDVDLNALCIALAVANDALSRHYLTEEQYTAILNNLSADYTAVNSVIELDYTERTPLGELITSTETLLGEVSTVDANETEITMQCDDENEAYYLYCNADGTATNGAGDTAGVAALLGENATNDTHLHTTYNNHEQDDDLDHYLRLDMGENEALVSFKFRYVGRVGSNNNAPAEMIIAGSNDKVNFEEIITLTNLPTTDATVEYTSDVLGNGKAYRYIRFMVTKTKNNAKNNGHPFFVLSQFAVTACETIEVHEDYVSPNLPLTTVVAANNEVVDAKEVNSHYAVEADYNVAKNELQAAYDALNLAKNLKDLPVILTTDASNPVLYKIKINRGATKLLEHNGAAGADKSVVVTDEEFGDRYQAWYFMQGSDDAAFDDVLIYPYWNEDAANDALKLGTNNISEGSEKVWAVDGTDDSYKLNWYITRNQSTLANHWNIQPEGKANYLSNHGGSDTPKIGFYNHADDAGSNFQFVLDETDYSLSDAYFALYNKYAQAGGTLTGGSAIGDYTVASVTAFNAAYNAAGALLEAKASTDDEYNNARTALENATIEYVMPEEGKLYVIKSISTNEYCSGKYVHALCDDRGGYQNQNHKHLVFDAEGDISQFPLAVFMFEDVNANGECKMKNLHTGMYVKSFIKNSEHMTTEEASAATVNIGNYKPGQAILKVAREENPMHAQDANRVIVTWEASDNGASLWSIEEVDPAQVVHNVAMSTSFSSVTLGYNAIVPAGIKAFNAVGIADGYVSLVTMAEEGGVIPANTPAILYRTDKEGGEKTFAFAYTEETAEQPDETLLGGSLYKTLIVCDGDDYYKLMRKDGVAKMYLMYKEYNASGESLGETHEGGHIKCSANKIYMKVPGGSQVASYGMRIVDGGTTGVDELNAENGKVENIYDLQGRKLTEITSPGFYIVNGKKVYVE